MEDPSSAAEAILSLLSMFMTCVQCFELIQHGRGLGQEFLILITRFTNQQLRFIKWGEACGLRSTTGYDSGLDGPELKLRIENTLQGIQVLLDSGIAISQTYLQSDEDHEIFVASQPVSTNWSWTIVKNRLRKCQRAQDTATRGALDEIVALESIAENLSDLIANLENMTEGLGVPERQRQLVQDELQNTSDTEILRLMEASWIKSKDMISETASARLRSLQDGCSPSSHELESIFEGLSVSDADLPHEVFATGPWEVISHDEASSEVIEHDSHILSGSLCGSLSTIKPDQETHKNLDVDKVVHGKAIEALSLDAFIQAAEKNADLFHGSKPPFYSQQQTKRLMREIENFERDKDAVNQRWWNIQFIGDNLRYVLGSFEGPADSPYEGGVFHVVIRNSETYPSKPPKVRIVTKIYHPNINHTGEICLNVLENDWTPVLTLEKVLISMSALLDAPGLDEPLVPEIAETYLWDRSMYDKKARAYTLKYAHEGNPTSETVDRFINICEAMASEVLAEAKAS